MVAYVPKSPAAPARKSLASVESLAKTERFLEDHLLINITRHELVPKHLLLFRDKKIADSEIFWRGFARIQFTSLESMKTLGRVVLSVKTSTR
ncbi:hypothetical protein CDV31_009498 [Fusarium ambrosium]|uniref:Uncharacterized protein n=1 Tax=Fusarium ambrosium TaxID=131363 RepID=A0A428TUI5_9HYPO|nr:hypothetical protein CDV31_009498 [Fusarium ambrosium]